jgi:hypothetical protein
MDAALLHPRDAALLDDATGGRFFEVLAAAYALKHDVDVQVSAGPKGSFIVYVVVHLGDAVIEAHDLAVGPTRLQARHRLTLRRLLNDDLQRQAERCRGASARAGATG